MTAKPRRRPAWHWSDWPLWTKGLVVIAIPLLGLLFVIVSFYFVQRENQTAQESVRHSLEVRSQIQSVHTQLEEAETSVRGYLLTGRRDWLAPYERAEANLQTTVKRLARMVADNPIQHARAQRIQVLIAHELSDLYSAASLQPQPEAANASTTAVLSNTEEQMNELRNELAAMRADEEQLLNERLDHADKVWRRSYGLVIAGVVFGPAAGIMAMLLFTAGVGRRVRMLDDNARRLAAGSALPPPSPATDEIGRLERSLHTAAGLLARRESELRDARDSLEVRVEERTMQLAGANEALRQANDTLGALIDASPLPIVGMDLNGYVRRWNRAAEDLFGWSADEVIGKRLPTVPDQFGDTFRLTLEAAREGESVRGLETRRRRKDGKLIDVRIWTAPLRDSQDRVRGKIGIVLDITERKQLEEQLAQAQKMEAVGRLAGGVAHDFNNLLTVISGYGQMVAEGVHNDPNLREPAEEVLKASNRAAALTGQLLAFSRRSIIQPKIVDLNELVADTEKMLRRIIGEDVQLKTVLRPGIPQVKVDPGQMQQVILNLAVNARDAMPGGGRLTIETAQVYLNEDYLGTHMGVKPGTYTMLAVTDTGAGMPPEVRAHIFEPFFTTKEKGKGTGLGLSTVYGIVKQHGGEIWVYSEPGKGTTFKVYLPAIVEPAAEQQQRQAPAARSQNGTETILIAEDEENVRKLIRSILEQQGYTVLEAKDGIEAMHVFDGHAGPIHLLVTDVVMPNMGGRDLAEALSLLKPDLKILFLSGYTDEAVVQHGALRTGSEFLEKPFNPEILARKVRQILDAPNGRAIA